MGHGYEYFYHAHCHIKLDTKFHEAPSYSSGEKGGGIH